MRTYLLFLVAFINAAAFLQTHSLFDALGAVGFGTAAWLSGKSSRR